MSKELYHHGIKGQHWGQRRYQNPDGSLTPEGIARYRKKVSNSAKIGAIAGAATGIGTVGLAVAQAATLGALNVAAVPAAVVGIGIKYAASGYLTGAAISMIKNSAQISVGRRYIQRSTR